MEGGRSAAAGGWTVGTWQGRPGPRFEPGEEGRTGWQTVSPHSGRVTRRPRASPSPGRPRFIHPRNALFRIRVGTTKKRAARLIAGGRGGSSRLTILVTKSLARAGRSRPQAHVRGMARERCVPGQDTVPAVLQNRGRARGGFGSWVNDD